MRIALDAATFQVARRGDKVVAPSSPGLEPADGPAWRPLSPVDCRDGRVAEQVPLTPTKASAAGNVDNWSILTFAETGPASRRIAVEVRACDDGIAVRYVMKAPALIAVTVQCTLA